MIYDAFGEKFECWVPPFGYGRNELTGEIEKCDVIKRNSKKEEQKWEREDLPDWYEKKREQEEIMQEADPDYVDLECEKVRERHWGRRIRGCWFWNNGERVYLPGRFWFLLNWWNYQGKYFDFRMPNLDLAYVLQYCYEDPDCRGLIEVTKRKDGKTGRAGCFAYEYISRAQSKHGGAQSKTKEDAEELFAKAIVTPFTKLPHFFQPIHDRSSGDIPKKELRFFHTSRKGVRKKKKLDPALESWIDFKNAIASAYDGPELHWYISDECGKLELISILERDNVVRMCSEVNGRYVGFHHYTTTVEDMEGGGSEFLDLVKMSNRRELNKNGRTASGMYVFFMPAYRTMNFDDYGFPDEEKNKVFYLNQREALKDRPRDLSGYIRKNPFTLQEAFRVDGEKCLFNSENLNEQLDWLSWHPDVVERGNFEWKEGVRFSEVVWVKSRNGRWRMPVAFEMHSANAIEKINGRYIPRNSLNFRIGCDPFKYNKVKDNRRSDCAAFAGQMFNPANPSDIFNDALICRYRFRAATTALANEDILKMCWYFGCQVLFERNVDHWKAYFIENGCEDFLMKLPGEDEYGVYSDGHGGMIQAICDLLEDMIENQSKKLFFRETIEEYLEFDPGDTTKSDETIASGVTKIAMKKKQYRSRQQEGREVSYFIKVRKAV